MDSNNAAPPKVSFVRLTESRIYLYVHGMLTERENEKVGPPSPPDIPPPKQQRYA